MPLRIPAPCHEDWNSFAGNGPSRHCARCDADVRDATAPDGSVVAGTCTRAWRLPDGRVVGGALLLAALAACAPHVPSVAEPVVTCAPERAPPGVLTVVVLDQDGLPLPSAVVTTSLGERLTDGEGRVSWEGVAHGSYEIRVERQGFSSASGRAVIAEEGAKLTVELGYTGGDIIMGMVVVEDPPLDTEKASRGIHVGSGMMGKVPR